MKKKIAIIGSGIAGLTAANLFKKNSDFEVIVYEKEKTLSLQEGYGIQLSTNSISILNKLGLPDVDNKDFFNPKKLDFYSVENNKICELDLTRFNKDNNKYTTLKRSTLIEFLKNKIFENNIRFGKEVKKVSKIKEKLLINFSDHTNDLVDFIIICDGVFSRTKSIIEKKNTNPVYNGSIAIRTIINSPDDFKYDKESISLVMFSNAHIVIYPINKKNEFNLVCIVRQKSFKNNEIKSIIEKEILSQNKNLYILFKGNLESWPIYVTKKPAKSIYNNLFYLGDAFYTFYPTLAQGASQSIEGANELFNLLSEDIKETQKIYFEKRVNKTKLIDNRSKLNHFFFHLSNPIMIKLRNKMLKKITKSEKFLDVYFKNIYRSI